MHPTAAFPVVYHGADYHGVPRPPRIGVLHFGQELPVARLLARAFVDDPLLAAICDVPAAERLRRMEWSFRIALRSHCLSPHPAWTAADPTAGTVGVALVTQPGWIMPGGADVWFTLRALAHVGARTFIRSMRAGQIIAGQAPPGPFTYLRTLGVDPDFHGRGFGSQLVAHVLHTAAPAWPVYLETASETNVNFYVRNGLTCIGEFQCLGVRIWRMLHAPVSKAHSPRQGKEPR